MSKKPSFNIVGLKVNDIFIPGEVALKGAASVLVDSVITVTDSSSISLASTSISNNFDIKVVNNFLKLSNIFKSDFKAFDINGIAFEDVAIINSISTNNIDYIDSLNFALEFIPTITGNKVSVDVNAFDVFKNGNVELTSYLNSRVDVSLVKELLDIKNNSKINSLTGFLNYRGKYVLAASLNPETVLDDFRISAIAEASNNFVLSNFHAGVEGLGEAKINFLRSEFPIVQNFEIHGNDLFIGSKYSRGWLDRFAGSSYYTGYADTIFVNFDDLNDNILITDARFRAGFNNLTLDIQEVYGNLFGGNFRLYSNVDAKKDLAISLQNPNVNIKKSLINLFDSLTLETGFEAKRLDMRVLADEQLYSAKDDFLVNVNMWLKVKDPNFHRGFSKTAIDADIDITRIDPKASLVLIDELYYYTRESNLRLLRAAIRAGYGLDRFNMNINENLLTSTAFLRGERRNIIPMLIRIRPNVYEVITNLDIKDVLKLYTEDLWTTLY